MEAPPGALGADSRNKLWLGMLWGYDLPHVVIARGSEVRTRSCERL